MSKQQLLVYGNPVDGFTHVGPFPDSEAASEYATSNAQIRDDTWWTVDLEPGEPEEKNGALPHRDHCFAMAEQAAEWHGTDSEQFVLWAMMWAVQLEDEIQDGGYRALLERVKYEADALGGDWHRGLSAMVFG